MRSQTRRRQRGFSRDCPGVTEKEPRMNRLTSSLIGAAVVGQLIGLLGWIDPVFVPLVLLGPVVTGAVAAARRVSYSWIAVLWFSAGINMLWTDYLINHEDV